MLLLKAAPVGCTQPQTRPGPAQPIIALEGLPAPASALTQGLPSHRPADLAGYISLNKLNLKANSPSNRLHHITRPTKVFLVNSNSGFSHWPATFQTGRNLFSSAPDFSQIDPLSFMGDKFKTCWRTTMMFVLQQERNIQKKVLKTLAKLTLQQGKHFKTQIIQKIVLIEEEEKIGD